MTVVAQITLLDRQEEASVGEYLDAVISENIDRGLYAIAIVDRGNYFGGQFAEYFLSIVAKYKRRTEKTGNKSVMLDIDSVPEAPPFAKEFDQIIIR